MTNDEGPIVESVKAPLEARTFTELTG